MPRALASAAPAPSAPARFIEELRAVAPAGRALDVERLPDGRTTLVFRVTDSGRRADVAVSGPRTRAHFKHATGVVRAVMLQFRPGWAAPLLGVAAHALTDRIVSLEDLWGRAGADLAAELLAAPSLPEAIEQLTRALTRRAHQTPEPASGRLARRAVRLLEAGEPRVEAVAAELGVTARHLRRAFTESIGVGPKEFARAVRLQRAVRSAANTADWARVAADSGYYDQSHLIADFRQLLGLTPSAFLLKLSAAAARRPVPAVDRTRVNVSGRAVPDVDVRIVRGDDQGRDDPHVDAREAVVVPARAVPDAIDEAPVEPIDEVDRDRRVLDDPDAGRDPHQPRLHRGGRDDADMGRATGGNERRRCDAQRE